MARNGAGTYNLPIGNPVTTGTTISSTWANNTLSDIATALTGSISSDGQTAVSANLPMSGYAHTGVANATVRTMYASAGQVQDGVLTNLTLASGTDAITAVASVGMTAYATGQTFTFIAAGTNTGAVTLNINSIGAKAITKNGATALSAGDIASGAIVQVSYDGTQFQLISANGVVKSFSAGTTGLTPSTATSGSVTLAGTLNVANGGTGATSLTANNVILGNGTSAVQVVAPGTSGNVLTSNGTTWTSAALNFDKSLSANGYQKIPGGLIMQWGETASINSDSTLSVTFPTAFTTSCFQVLATGTASTSGTGEVSLNTRDLTTTTFTMVNDGGKASTARWFAVGY